MQKYLLFHLALCFWLCGCNRPDQIGNSYTGPKIVEAKGYVVPKDSIAAPQVISVDVGKLKKIPAGTPKVTPTNTHIFPAGKPRVVIAGTPRICTPGQDTFSLPKTVPAIDSPFVAGVPEVVEAKDAYSKDQNPQNFSIYGKLQGLKHGTINCLLEDTMGNLWFGTYGGVAKYDGKFFTHFTDNEGLGNNFILSILEDKKGNLWFGTDEAGVSRYDGRSFTHFTQKDGLTHNVVRSILEDRNGNIWFGTYGGGVSRYDPSASLRTGGKSFTHFTEKEGLNNNYILSILEDKQGNLWFGTDGAGASRFDGKSFIHFTEKEGLSHSVVRRIIEDNSGNLWFCTQGGGVSMYDGTSFTHYSEKEGLSHNVVLSAMQDQSGHLWFGTYGGGISKYDGKSFTSFTEKEGLSHNVVLNMMEDKSGHLWFGTAAGVSRLDGKSFTHFTEKEGLSNNYILNILEDTSGLWFATINGVSLYEGYAFSHFTEKEGLSLNVVGNILKDNSGNLWFATHGGGISKYDGKFFTHFTEADGLSNNFVLSAAQDRGGNFWFGTYGGGVSRYDGNSFTHFTEKEGLSHNNVNRILEDKHGNLWFGTDGGVTRYDGNSFTHFTEKEGLSHNVVESILEDAKGNLWFGTYGGGVSRYDGTSFIHFTEKDGLSNYISSLLEDKNGNLWFGTRFGLCQTTQARLDEILNKVTSGTLTESDVVFKNYTYEDGFLGIGCNGNAMYEDSYGTIWVGTNDRLTAYHPPASGKTADASAPNIQITGIDLFHEPIPWQTLEQYRDSTLTLGNGIQVSHLEFDGVTKWYGLPENLSLKYDHNYLTFEYIGITHKQSKKVKYQYILEGNDDHWSSLTSRTEAPYGNLRHGSYIFKVKAMNSEGYWSNEFHYPFTIRPPWWLTWWAYCVYALSGLIVIWGVYRYQKQRIVRREREKIQQRELEHAREIEKAYTQLETAHENLKTMQTQLIQSEKMASLGQLTAGIAHEIQNPLNFVNNFSDLNTELIEEMQTEFKAGRHDKAFALAENISENARKINHHGRRADAIVKGMLQHSRSSTGTKQPTDINALADEYLRLAYHGFRAKDKMFHAQMKTDFDTRIGEINIAPQDIGRVVLNLVSNAFYAVTEKAITTTGQLSNTGHPSMSTQFEPTVTVTTKRLKSKVEIRVKDNGMGIPEKVKDKIFEPFFTTKPAGQGTGLGLSLAYDIVTKGHGGELKVESKFGEGTEFIILLPAWGKENS